MTACCVKFVCLMFHIPRPFTPYPCCFTYILFYPIYRAGLYVLSHDAEATNGPIVEPYKCLCVCVMCSSRQSCTVFGIAPSLKQTSFFCAKSRTARAPVGRPVPARPSGRPVAGQPPSTQPARLGTSVSTSGADSDQTAL